MRSMSKAAKAASYDEVAHELDLYRLATWYLACGDVPDHVEKRVIVCDASTFEWRLYNCDRADGGLLVQLYHQPGEKRPDVHVFLYERWLNDVRDMIGYGRADSPHDIAVEAARDAANNFRAAVRKLYQEK